MAHEEYKKGLGAAVKELRELKGWSMRELARRSGVSAGFVSRMEGADAWNSTINNLSRVSDALGLPVGELLNYVPRSRQKCSKCGGRGWVFIEGERE